MRVCLLAFRGQVPLEYQEVQVEVCKVYRQDYNPVDVALAKAFCAGFFEDPCRNRCNRLPSLMIWPTGQLVSCKDAI
jgi:hypothetical protein